MWLYICVLVSLYAVTIWILGSFKIRDCVGLHVLITGCDTGFGHGLAIELDKMGFIVYATCYTDGAAAELKLRCSKNMVTVTMDVGKDDSVAAALAVIGPRCQNSGLWGLVNNAGITGPWVPLDMIRMEQIQETVNVNLFGMIRVTKAFMPFIRKARGRIINTSSLAGRMAVSPVPYCIAKYGVEGFSDRLRAEVWHTGVYVLVIEPGAFKTPIILNIDKLVNDNLKSYSVSDQDVQAYYGHNYIRDYNDFTRSAYMKYASSATWKVVEAYKHALIAVFPKYRYLVGVEANTMFRFLFNCPEWIQDWVFRTVILPIRPSGNT